jgi:glycosyltransferase involved in cell wall biosynthesis
MVHPRNPKMLAHALRKLIDNPEERYRMGREGRRIVEDRFSDDIIAAKTTEVYKVYGFLQG